MTLDNFKSDLEQIMRVNPEVIFWEPINARGTNGKRMLAAGLEFTSSIMSKKSWAECFKRQWEEIETAAMDIGCLDRLHIWPDPELRGELKGDVDKAKLERWLYKPTVEKWDNLTVSTNTKANSTQPIRKNSKKMIAPITRR